MSTRRNCVIGNNYFVHNFFRSDDAVDSKTKNPLIVDLQSSNKDTVSSWFNKVIIYFMLFAANWSLAVAFVMLLFSCHVDFSLYSV